MPSFKDGESQPPTMETLIIQQGIKSDWWFVGDVIKKFGYDLLITGDGETTGKDGVIHKGVTKAVVAKPDEWRKTHPKMSFVLRGGIDTQNNIFPILEFDSPSDWVWLTPGLTKMYAYGVNFSKALEAVAVELGITPDRKSVV